VIGPATAQCPATRLLLGGGATIATAGGTAAAQTVALKQSYPTAGGAAGTWSATAVRAAAGAATSVTLTAYVICTAP
jgi:hypothetical protein